MSHDGSPGFTFGSRQAGRTRGYRHHTGSDVTEASFDFWDGREQRAVKLEAGQAVGLRLTSQLSSGRIECEVHAPDGALALALGDEPACEATLRAAAPGKYHVLVTATEACGSYRLSLFAV